jgi:hypothetical protein
MYFDNLTLAGLLVTVPYIVMLIIFSRRKTAPDAQDAAAPACLKKELCCCGTWRWATRQSSPCTLSCAANRTLPRPASSRPDRAVFLKHRYFLPVPALAIPD